ncbi:MAG TPA: hypothetical protein VFR23_25345 [Jiangellaceae bacterium]|nr:hypothetical protein [Jiangellaceae bacterium]
MSSAANLDTNTTGVPPRYGDEPCRCGKHTVKQHASLTLADHAGTACDCGDNSPGCLKCRAETRLLLDMFGLPPCERALRTSKGERNRGGDYAKRGGE